MAIGERIHYFRLKRGLTMKALGMAAGFPAGNADVRMAQYEAGRRSPKADLTNALAEALEVSPAALNVPDIDSYIGLMHTFFTLEDLYGLTIDELDGTTCLRVDVRKGSSAGQLSQMLQAWKEQAAKLRAGEITQEDYDRWRYNYPKQDTENFRPVTPPIFDDLDWK